MQLPFYFLSILFNLIAGLILCADYINDKITGFSSVSEFIGSSKAKFIIGTPTFIIGFIKLLIPVSTNAGIGRWIFLGDLVPATAGMILGFALLMDFLKQKAIINTETLMRLDSMMIQNKSKIGVAGLIVAFLHFILYNWLFL